jgi:hypothetical protein
MHRYIARANIGHYLSVLSSTDLTERNRETVIKLLVGEEDRLSHDLEQLQFAEDRPVRAETASAVSQGCAMALPMAQRIGHKRRRC